MSIPRRPSRSGELALLIDRRPDDVNSVPLRALRSKDAVEQVATKRHHLDQIGRRSHAIK